MAGVNTKIRCFLPRKTGEDKEAFKSDASVWSRDTGKHFCGDFSYAVVPANAVIEDCSQVETCRSLFNNLVNRVQVNGNDISQDVINNAFAATETGFLSVGIGGTVGSCCLVGIIKGRTLYVANLGDSRAVLGLMQGRKIVAVQLTVDHNVQNPEIRAELEGRHQGEEKLIIYRDGAWWIRGVIQRADYEPPFFFRSSSEQEDHHPLQVEFGNVSSTDLLSAALKVKSPLRVKDWINCYHLQQTDILLSTFPDISEAVDCRDVIYIKFDQLGEAGVAAGCSGGRGGGAGAGGSGGGAGGRVGGGGGGGAGGGVGGGGGGGAGGGVGGGGGGRGAGGGGGAGGDGGGGGDGGAGGGGGGGGDGGGGGGGGGGAGNDDQEEDNAEDEEIIIHQNQLLISAKKPEATHKSPKSQERRTAKNKTQLMKKKRAEKEEKQKGDY